MFDSRLSEFICVHLWFHLDAVISGNEKKKGKDSRDEEPRGQFLLSLLSLPFILSFPDPSSTP
jgi:hypothetical protein